MRKGRDGMDEQILLQRVCSAFENILGGKLTGFYVHGSIAFGCFSWATGDVDFLCVVSAPLTQAEKEALIRVLLALTPEAPPKGFEMSVLLRDVCSPLRYPTPFEMHFSNAHKTRAEQDLTAFCRDMHGTDPDLAAHITVLHRVGVTLLGEPISAVFAPVPRECYLDSILGDVSGAEADIRQSPVYTALNLCRVLAYLTDDAVLSKAQGGQWALAHLPEEWRPLLRSALSAYACGASIPEEDALPAFAAMMLGRIRLLLP